MRDFAILLTVFLCSFMPLQAQLWAPLLNPGQAIDWSASGAGTIPPRPKHCADLTPSATTAQINLALASCPADQAVFLAAGTYSIAASIRVPSNVTLRGAGADLTILNSTALNGQYIVSLGDGSVPFNPRIILAGATAGSTQIELGSVAGVRVGKYLAITEMNDPSFVTASGSGGNCNWCDGGWTKTGDMSRGQIVAVTAVNGNRVTISPGLYGPYTKTPTAVPFNMSATYAGVEDLQVRANNLGYFANFGLSACAYCWIKGVESNYADGDHVYVLWGFHDEIRDSYFSNAFIHTPGTYDADIDLVLKTSASLVENNIIERTHEAVMLEWGSAGNVISYNYTMGEFDNESPNVMIGGVNFHAAHPQFTLIEGNVLTAIYPDSVWGSSSHTTALRNWVVGTNRICDPLQGRGVVNCSGKNGHYGFEGARAIQLSYLTTRNNFIGNIIGSEQMQSLFGFNRPVPQFTSLEYPADRNYLAATGWSFGYGRASDSGADSGCHGGIAPCHRAGTSSSNFIHGNYNNLSRSISWTPGIPHAIPPSFYLTAKPAWWRGMPFPAIGPDLVGGEGPGGHIYGNPARACYLKVMGGSDGGAGGPLGFNAGKCYGTAPILRIPS